MKSKLGVAAPLIAIALLGAPGVTRAATLAVNRACVGPTEPVVFSGAGFTPNGEVALTTNGRQIPPNSRANAMGVFARTLTPPTLSTGERADPFTATDMMNPALTGSTSIRVTALNVTVAPRSGNPARVRRIKARGFTRSSTLYAHVRGRIKRNSRIGKLKAPCGRLSVRKRIFPRGTRPGTYKVQFDGSRRYRASRRPRVSFNVTVFRTSRSSATQAARLDERWQLTD